MLIEAFRAVAWLEERAEVDHPFSTRSVVARGRQSAFGVRQLTDWGTSVNVTLCSVACWFWRPSCHDQRTMIGGVDSYHAFSIG